MPSGLGAMQRSTPLRPVREHGGFVPGHLSKIRYYAGHNVAVAVQFKTSVPWNLGREPGRLAHEVAPAEPLSNRSK
jgi:hypothetical protein